MSVSYAETSEQLTALLRQEELFPARQGEYPICTHHFYGGHEITLRGLVQDNKSSLTLPCTGLAMWEAGTRLVQFLANNPKLIMGKHVVELGDIYFYINVFESNLPACLFLISIRPLT